jgi:hypothetical protein
MLGIKWAVEEYNTWKLTGWEGSNSYRSTFGRHETHKGAIQASYLDFDSDSLLICWSISSPLSAHLLGKS